MLLLILESLGSTELLFILIMALVFFGPRKLPQLSRSLGKNLAEFRKASEDFKRTWEKEVNLEEFASAVDFTATPSTSSAPAIEEPSIEQQPIMDYETPSGAGQRPLIEAVTPDRVIARHSPGSHAPLTDNAGLQTDDSDFQTTSEAKPSPKHDWL